MIYNKLDDGRQYVSGIYFIKSLCGKVYVGSAVKLKMRFMSHRKTLQDNKHDNSRLQNYFNKYGEASLSFHVIEYCDREKLLEREQYYLDTINPFFNIARTAGATYGLKPWLGKKHSQETKDKIKKAGLITFSKKPKKVKPVKLSKEENIKRISEINKTPEGRKRCSDLHKGNTHWLGKKHKPETIANRLGALNGNSKKVICIELDKTFDTCKEAYLYFGLSRGAITNSIARGGKIKGLYTMKYVS